MFIDRSYGSNLASLSIVLRTVRNSSDRLEVLMIGQVVTCLHNKRKCSRWSGIAIGQTYILFLAGSLLSKTIVYGSTGPKFTTARIVSSLSHEVRYKLNK